MRHLHSVPLGRWAVHIASMLALLWAATQAQAGGLSVMPTRLDMGQGRGVQSVLLTNTSAQTVTVETQVMVWPEGAGGQMASDIVVNPAVITLPPNQRMRVRIGLLRPDGGELERAYRIYFTELPAPSPLQGAGIGVRLRVGIPLFVAPLQAQPQPLQWSARQGPQGWQVEARNTGNVHSRMARPVLVVDGREQPLQAAGTYVLARTGVSLPVGAHWPAGARVRWLDGDDERESAVAGP